MIRGLSFLTLRAEAPVAERYQLWAAPETPWYIVLTQDCDLEQDADARAGANVRSDKKLWGVLLAPGWNADDVVEGRHLQGVGYEDLRDSGGNWIQRLRGTAASYLLSNRNERWHFVAAHELTGGIDLAFDFKLAATVHPSYLDAAIGAGTAQRVAHLGQPWSNDLAHRYITFLGRVALPE